MFQHRLITARARHDDDLGQGIRDAGEDGGRRQNLRGALVGEGAGGGENDPLMNSLFGGSRPEARGPPAQGGGKSVAKTSRFRFSLSLDV